MKIAVIGAGAMGSLYGGLLSANNEVYLIDTNPDTVSKINESGLILTTEGTEKTYRPTALHAPVDGQSASLADEKTASSVDLIILFVKAFYSKAALSANRLLIGKNTYVMTLQNGMGHEAVLSEFVPREHIIIGTTQSNASVVNAGHVAYGGSGETNIGLLTDDTAQFLPKVKQVLDEAGFHCFIRSNIMQLIWDKLFVNISLSAVTGILQVPIGYISANEDAWALTVSLLDEAVTVAGAEGITADKETLYEKVKKTSEASPGGLTSIYMDIKLHRKTEVDTISGSVIRAARRHNIPVPAHEFVVHMIHALEGK